MTASTKRRASFAYCLRTLGYTLKQIGDRIGVCDECARLLIAGHRWQVNKRLQNFHTLHQIGHK